MSAAKGTWPAFPANHYDMIEHEHGLSIRDYFAAKVLNGVFAYAATDVTPETCRPVANICYIMADAMLAAREAA